ncbi:MAG: hypothetical protein MR601_07905 [Erysipelotrichaceae bacterium]|nr:hypothetical protein [Erysipelotrichaceae bacterium]
MEKNCIVINIENETELLNKWDSEKSFNEDFKSYIISKTNEISNNEKINLIINSNNFIEQSLVADMFFKWINKEIRNIQNKKVNNTIKQIKLLIIGILFIVISLYIEQTNNIVLFTVISTIGAFAVWEAASIWIIENPELRKNNKILNKINKNLNIIVNNKQGL